MPDFFSVENEDKNSSARVGKMRLSHGMVETPFFMPVATKGSVKHLSLEEVSKMGVRVLISNAFIFYLRPGLAVIEEAGGIHSFINWKHNLFTDSGGFQILDDSFLVARSDKGVFLNNPFVRKKELFTPEKCIEIQNRLNSDVAMVLDDVPRFGSEKPFLAETLRRTLDWASRCKKAHANEKQKLFGISQGGVFWDLRENGLKKLNELDFDGIALGGLSIGEPKETMQKIISKSRKTIPSFKPLYVMGLGSPEDIVEAIGNGADIFDSCFPTRVARHKTALTFSGRVNISNKKFESDFSSLDEACDCFVCKSFTKAYLHHLVVNSEESGFRFLTHHNISFVQCLIEGCRLAILENCFNSFSRDFLRQYFSAK